MNEMAKMVIVLTALSVISGGSLAGLRQSTKERIESQQLLFVKGPAIKSVLQNISNDPIADRFKIKDPQSNQERSFFVGIVDGKAKTVAFESAGKGFGGDIGLMVGVDTETDKILGIGVTTHAETPGLGARAKTEKKFTGQFKDKPLVESFKVKSDGGQVDALSGATVTSRGVAGGITEAGNLYKSLKPQIVDGLKAFNK
jgi:electron transport complex protein RnfG